MAREPYDWWPAPASHVVAAIAVLAAACGLALALLSEEAQLVIAPPVSLAVALMLRRSKRRPRGTAEPARVPWLWFGALAALTAIATALPILLFRPGPAWIIGMSAIVLVSVEVLHRRMRSRGRRG